MRRPIPAPIHCLIAICLLLGGCSTYQFVTPNAGWRTQIGQLLYSSPKRTVIGETVVTRMGDSQFQLDFMAGPGLPILTLRKDGTRGRAEAAFARVSWQGNADHAVGPLKSWFALHEVFTAADALHGSSVHTKLNSEKADFWTADVTIVNGKPVELKIEFPHTKERFFFHFSS